MQSPIRYSHSGFAPLLRSAFELEIPTGRYIATGGGHDHLSLPKRHFEGPRHTTRGSSTAGELLQAHPPRPPRKGDETILTNRACGEGGGGVQVSQIRFWIAVADSRCVGRGAVGASILFWQPVSNSMSQADKLVQTRLCAPNMNTSTTMQQHCIMSVTPSLGA